MVLWTKELECTGPCSVIEKEDELIDNEILNNYFLHKDPSGGPNSDYIKCSEVKKLIKDNINTAVEVATKRVVTGIVEEKVGDTSTEAGMCR